MKQKKRMTTREFFEAYESLQSDFQKKELIIDYYLQGVMEGIQMLSELYRDDVEL